MLAKGVEVIILKDRDKELEKIIFDAVKLHQKKIALVASRALNQGFSEAEVGGKIYMLCVEGRLKVHGDILRWRYSEIALPTD